MKANTYESRLIAGLIALGWVEDKSDRSHYTAFTHPTLAHKTFVGKNGALRRGVCASKSFSIGDASHQSPRYLDVLAKGDAKLALTQTSSRVDLTPYA